MSPFWHLKFEAAPRFLQNCAIQLQVINLLVCSIDVRRRGTHAEFCSEFVRMRRVGHISRCDIVDLKEKEGCGDSELQDRVERRRVLVEIFRYRMTI